MKTNIRTIQAGDGQFLSRRQCYGTTLAFDNSIVFYMRGNKNNITVFSCSNDAFIKNISSAGTGHKMVVAILKILIAQVKA